MSLWPPLATSVVMGLCGRSSSWYEEGGVLACYFLSLSFTEPLRRNPMIDEPGLVPLMLVGPGRKTPLTAPPNLQFVSVFSVRKVGKEHYKFLGFCSI